MVPCQPGISPPKASVVNDGCPFLELPSRGEITAGCVGDRLGCELCSGGRADTKVGELASDDAGKAAGCIEGGLGDGGRWEGGAGIWDGSVAGIGGEGEASRTGAEGFG